MKCKNYEPVEIHTSCDGCVKFMKTSPGDNDVYPRKCWTPAQPEPHLSCDGCWNEDDEGDCGDCMSPPGDETRKNYTPKQPEPAAPVKSCATCKHENEMRAEVSCCNDCDGYSAWEPKAEPGLVSYPIDGLERDWKVIYPDDWHRLYIAIGRKDFDHIECATGSIVYALQAFDPNDPPVRAYFRK